MNGHLAPLCRRLRSASAGSFVPWRGLAAAFVAFSPAPLASSAEFPPLAELVSKLQSVLPSVPPPQSNSMPAGEYVRSLQPWVLLSIAEADAPGSLVTKSVRYPDGAGYLRVTSVSAGLSNALAAAAESLSQSGPVAGWIVDLRFASGSSHADAVDAASVWSARDALEFKLGSSAWQLRPGTSPPSAPVVILVNRQTRHAAETLAAALRRSAARSILLGTNTAGRARAYQPVTVAPEMMLQVASQALVLPDGTEFPARGLEPDLFVPVSEDDERVYAVDEYSRVESGRSLRASASFRLNEAELVRRRRQPRPPDGVPARRSRTLQPRESVLPDSPGRSGEVPATGPVPVRDPVLALALDLVSGIATASDGTSTGGDSR